MLFFFNLSEKCLVFVLSASINFFLKLFILYWSVNNVVIVSGSQQRDSAMHIHVAILSQTPLPSRLPHNIEQSFLCYTIGPCWLKFLFFMLKGRPSLLRPSRVHAKSLQLCSALCDPMDCSLTDSPVHGTLQARILEWIAMPFSSGIFLTQGLNARLLHRRQILYHQATQEARSHQTSPVRFPTSFIGHSSIHSANMDGAPAVW